MSNRRGYELRSANQLPPVHELTPAERQRAAVKVATAAVELGYTRDETVMFLQQLGLVPYEVPYREESWTGRRVPEVELERRRALERARAARRRATATEATG